MPSQPPTILHRDTTDPSVFQTAVWGRVFNKRRDTSRVPLAFVKARTTADVVAAVKLAETNSARVSVRSGGHSWAGWSVRSDAVLVDLGDLDVEDGAEEGERPAWAVDGGRGGGRGRVEYDERSRVVSCPASTTGRMLNGYLKDRGRMFAGGHCPDVGLGGFLLQGGMGWNCKNWGWACESVVGIDVVTAEGRELHASSVENADLFWAAKGAGPGFPAIVTRFYLLTRPLLEMYQSLYVFPISEHKRVLQWVVDISPTADPETEIVAVSSYLPGDEDLTFLANFTCFKSSKAAAEAALTPIHASRPSGAKIEVFCDRTSLAKEYGTQACANPEGHRYCAENAYVSNDEDVPSVLEKGFTTLPSRKSFAIYFAMNPTSRRALPADDSQAGMALSMQSDHYFALYTVWEDEADDERCTAWVRDVMREVERHADGSYLGDSDFQYRRTRFWSEEAGKKLMEVRRRWDPKGRICGYLDKGDLSGVDGLKNEFEWK
ncbi:FAD binding domain protein [Coniochaeta sp. PMI_546]|nr:FAD binding domain protein [Coniochaeta sp. PMI_546]